MAAEKNITRSFFSNSLNIFTIRFLSTLANLMVVIYFSHTLSRFDYGRYGAFWVQLNIGIIIASCGFALIAFTYKPEQLLLFLKQLKKRSYFIYALFILLCGCAFSFLLQGYNITHFNTLNAWIPAVFFICYTLAFLLETALIVFRRFIPLLIISIVYPVIFFGIHWYAANKTPFSMEWLIQWLLVLVAVKAAVGVVYMINCIKRLPGNTEAATLSVKAVKKLWLHLGVYDVAQMVFRSVDKLIISLIASKEALAIYYNGSQDIPFLPIFLASIRSASLIQLSQAGGRSEDAVKISNKAAAILSTIAFAALAYVLCFRYEIIVTVFSEKYIPALQIFVCSMLIIPAQFCCPVFFILQNKQKGTIINQGAILDMVLAILLMIPFYQFWGPVGIAISIVVAAYFQTGYYLYHTAKVLAVPVIALMPLKDWAGKLVLFGSINIIVHYTCSRWMMPLYSLVTGGLITGTIALCLLLKEYRKMNKRDNLIVNDAES